MGQALSVALMNQVSIGRHVKGGLGRGSRPQSESATNYIVVGDHDGKELATGITTTQALGVM
jgi:hypothetical protein